MFILEAICYLGNLDLCYFNQGCLTDSTLYEDTSHITSNIVYSIIGIGFIFIVAVKNYQLSSKYKEIGNNGDATVYGVLFDTKLFYSLGLGKDKSSICKYTLKISTV